MLFQIRIEPFHAMKEKQLKKSVLRSTFSNKKNQHVKKVNSGLFAKLASKTSTFANKKISTCQKS